MINDENYNRRYVISAFVVLVVLIYITRLFMLQIVDQASRERADSNALVRQPVYPSRGLIYDRNGELLVFNQPIYEVTMILREMRHGFDTIAFCQSMHISMTEFDERIKAFSDKKKNRGFSRYTPQVFMSQLSKEDIADLQENLYRYKGVGIRKRTLRDYAYQSSSHVLGSVGEISAADLEKDNYYQLGDYIGRDGIERTYEKELRGEKGVEVLMRDARGRIQGSYREGEMDIPAESGKNLTLTVDIRLQLLAEDLLQNKIGSAVAIEPKTGEILAMVSSPNWNPAQLVGRERSANYNNLLNDPNKPLMNRATQALYPPGSTFKLLQALTALQEKGITESSIYPCNGPQSLPIKCTHHHGSPVDLEEAIEQSCNPYFWLAFQSNMQKEGYGTDNMTFRARYEQWREDICSFGLGDKFEDTDLSEQSAGSIPTTAYYDKYYGKTGWKALTIRSLSIGQGEILVTPMQLANEAAAIANKGYYFTPHLNKNMPFNTAKHVTNVEAHYFDIVHRGMHRMMTAGTGRYYNVDTLMMCGKTGTAQNPHGKDHAIYIGFAPMDNPQIAVAVVVENAGFGATWAAPVGSLMMELYLTDTITRPWVVKRLEDADFIHPAKVEVTP